MMRSIKKSRRKGFTVGELLIVVAIIAVLVSIAIPVLTNKLEKAREAYDIYTMRQAASAAIELYYAGITDAASANAAGLMLLSIGRITKATLCMSVARSAKMSPNTA